MTPEDADHQTITWSEWNAPYDPERFGITWAEIQEVLRKQDLEGHARV